MNAKNLWCLPISFSVFFCGVETFVHCERVRDLNTAQNHTMPLEHPIVHSHCTNMVLDSGIIIEVILQKSVTDS